MIQPRSGLLLKPTVAASMAPTPLLPARTVLKPLPWHVRLQPSAVEKDYFQWTIG
jgi:hypothetical protein